MAISDGLGLAGVLGGTSTDRDQQARDRNLFNAASGTVSWGTSVPHPGKFYLDSGSEPLNVSFKEAFKETFFRINEKVGYNEGQIIEDPLDLLRLKISRWLGGKSCQNQ